MTVKVYTPSVVQFIAGVNLDKRDEGVQGYYIAAAGLSADWRGCAVLQTLDNGQNFTLLAQLRKPSVMGVVTEVWHEGIIVRLLHGGMQLESFSPADIEGGKNRAYLCSREAGGEDANDADATVISFENAQLIAQQTYSLTGLTLGRKQTAQVQLRAGMHFTLLTQAALARVDCLDSERRLGLFIAASIGQKASEEPLVGWESFR